MRGNQATLSLLALIAALGLDLVGCNSRDPVVLSLRKQKVHRSDFERYLRGLEAQEVDTREPIVRRSLFDVFVEERVLVLEARARGFLTNAAASQEEEERAVRRMIADDVCVSVGPTEAEIADHFKKHGSEFQDPGTVTLRHILVPTENEARDIRRRLGKDPKEFEILARTRSRAPDAAAGGLLGTFKRGELPRELESAAFSLMPGPATQIVTSPYGFHVVRVDARSQAAAHTLEDSRERIQHQLRRQKCEQATQDFVRHLIDRAKVKRDAI